MQEGGLLLFRVGLDLVQLYHARLDGLLVGDAPFVRVPDAQFVQPVTQGV